MTVLELSVNVVKLTVVVLVVIEVKSNFLLNPGIEAKAFIKKNDKGG